MRLFVGLQPTQKFREALALVQDRLRESGVTGRYLDPSNLHMTLAFIGEWPENVSDLLPAVEKPFPMTLSHIGIFEEADVLWAGVRPSEELNHLAKRVRHILADEGIPFDRKSFNPHITLMRKPSIPSQTILADIEIPAVTMLVEDVCLYRSDRGKNGMVYTVIGRSEFESRTDATAGGYGNLQLL